MMKRGAVVLGGLLSLLACTSAQPAAPVLAYEEALPREQAPTCFSSTPDGTAFDEDRRQIREMHESLPANPRDAASRAQYLRDHARRWFDWRLPAPPADGGVEAMPRADPALTASLSAATDGIIAGDPPAAASVWPETFSSLLRRVGFMFCRGTVTLSAPALAGDFAFVETSYHCGGFCGDGRLYALRRQGGEWRLVAVAFTWVS